MRNERLVVLSQTFLEPKLLLIIFRDQQPRLPISARSGPSKALIRHSGPRPGGKETGLVKTLSPANNLIGGHESDFISHNNTRFRIDRLRVAS